MAAINKTIPKYSEKDSRGIIYVDCTECNRGTNGEKDCSAGARTKKGHQGGCFSGVLLDRFDGKML